ncbi:M23 family metallopeptidase [Halomonas cupida]|uniref:Murein DD-endopeptidase MepM and murein hydrolase activator NlpD, contain LysM domain n=2 Tax=Halomonas cupida TaxID=44933 RepID=A0A1M7KBY5_9GAMM|nr:M23 family metallopeptidase [Halomonas cupida]SHM62357.1 Murein DD-endopeptidase MepM and murein hydrolase activator NlpD, contain LysM domain [Halomonas cupida]
MNRKFLLAGFIILQPLTVEASWQERLLLSPSKVKGMQSVEQGQSASSPNPLNPRVITLDFGREISTVSSLDVSMEDEGVPSSVTEEFETVLEWLQDPPLDLSESDNLQISWKKDIDLNDNEPPEPRLTYAKLSNQDQDIELIVSEGKNNAVLLFKDEMLIDSFQPPIMDAQLTSRFGIRRHPVYGGARRHNGIDLAAPLGTPIMATAPGRVAFIGRRSGYGLVIEIEHDADTISRYTHLSRSASGLAVGDTINSGDILGEVGTSGVTTGPNLHYETRVNDRPVDPLTEGKRILSGTIYQQQNYQEVLYEARERFQSIIGTSTDPSLAALSE